MSTLLPAVSDSSPQQCTQRQLPPSLTTAARRKLANDKTKPEQVEPAVRQSLKNLQVDYVDLLHIHWPMSKEHEPVRTCCCNNYCLLCQQLQQSAALHSSAQSGPESG